MMNKIAIFDFIEQELAEDLRSSAAKIYPVQCDLTRELEIMRVFEWIETTIGQGVSVLINNASIEIKSQILGVYVFGI